ncbi:hypothetical protein NPIL_132181 [Nephila pilipes]|uniref:Uncharacterized protein n=1 Tax=Nephila pilipes TaxID=299642 RepID=A0A8X6PC79_NEPPI|nr:hypothetical protein NPIL_132181 [Nephila pilipes]
MWPLDVHYGSCWVHQCVSSSLTHCISLSAALPQRATFRVAQVVSAVATTPWGSETEPCPEGTGAGQSWRQHLATCRRHSPRNPCVASR